MERLARALDRTGVEVRVVATVGISLVVLGIGTLWYGGNQSIIPRSCRPPRFTCWGSTSAMTR